MQRDMQHNRGFTLIELMVVVMIIAILTAIALPSYRKYVMRTHRTDATKALTDLATREESYFYSNNTYTSTLSQLNASSTMAGSLFTVQVASASSTGYTLTATAQGTQAQDTCQSFSLTRAGVQSSNGAGTDAGNCWGK